MRTRDILRKVRRAIKKADDSSVMSEEEGVNRINKRAIDFLMKGDTEQALSLFLDALRKSGRNPELRAGCLLNIGDYLRRVNGALQSALKLFNTVTLLTGDSIVKSRLHSMKAMVYAYPTHRGKHDPEGLQRSIHESEMAVSFAYKAAAEERPEEALAAESFALHRLTGTVCNWGNDSQKKAALKMINDFFPRLNTDNPEVVRFNYSKATIIKYADAEEAGRILLECAIATYKEVPMDAFSYFVIAAECYIALGKKTIAAECIRWAEGILPEVRMHSNSLFEIQRFEDMKKQLN